MKETRIIICLLVLLFGGMLSSYSQEVSSNELVWQTRESLDTVSFRDASQIINWGLGQLPFSDVFYETLKVDNANVLILIVSGCSGAPCKRIFVFCESEDGWNMMKEAHSNLHNQLKMIVNDVKKSVIFMSGSSQIGELRFDQLISTAKKVVYDYSCVQIFIENASIVNYADVLFVKGEIVIRNESPKSIKLERSFDLDLKLLNENREVLKIDSTIINEYVNLINSKKRVKLKPNNEIRFSFLDSRLRAQELMSGSYYYLCYTFRILDYSKNELPICCPESIRGEIGVVFELNDK